MTRMENLRTKKWELYLELDVDEDSKGPVIFDREVTNAIESLKVG